MSKVDQLMVETRTKSGTGEARRIRREGGLPGSISSKGNESISVKLNSHNFEQVLHHHRSEHMLLDAKIDGKDVKRLLLKNVQHEPVTGEVLHVDLLDIPMTEKMKIKIAIRLSGEPVGVTRDGGLLEQLLREVEVECLPDDMQDKIDVDVSALALGDTLMVSDVVVDPKLTVLTDGDVAVANIITPRIGETEDEEAEADEAVVADTEENADKQKDKE